MFYQMLCCVDVKQIYLQVQIKSPAKFYRNISAENHRHKIMIISIDNSRFQSHGSVSDVTEESLSDCCNVS